MFIKFNSLKKGGRVICFTSVLGYARTRNSVLNVPNLGPTKVYTGRGTGGRQVDMGRRV